MEVRRWLFSHVVVNLCWHSGAAGMCSAGFDFDFLSVLSSQVLTTYFGIFYEL